MSETPKTSNEIVAFVETTYWLTDKLPTVEEMAEYAYMTVEQVLLKLPTINSVLVESRGLPPVGEPKKTEAKTAVSREKFDSVPDHEFVLACNYIVNTLDKRSTVAKLKDIGLTTQRFNAMLKKKVNSDYWKKRVESQFKSGDESAKIALLKNIENGDLQSIKHYHEVTGIYRPNQEILLNLGVLIAQLMEVLARNVSQEVLDKVTTEFDQIIQISTESVKELESA